METDAVDKDCWIVGQLAGIRMLERELSEAFKRPRESVSEDLRRRVDELNSWLNLVDEALTFRTSSALRPSQLGGGGVILPFRGSGNRFPAA
jgi:hypothetical protein